MSIKIDLCGPEPKKKKNLLDMSQNGLAKQSEWQITFG